MHDRRVLPQLDGGLERSGRVLAGHHRGPPPCTARPRRRFGRVLFDLPERWIGHHDVAVVVEHFERVSAEAGGTVSDRLRSPSALNTAAAAKAPSSSSFGGQNTHSTSAFHLPRSSWWWPPTVRATANQQTEGAGPGAVGWGRGNRPSPASHETSCCCCELAPVRNPIKRSIRGATSTNLNAHGMPPTEWDRFPTELSRIFCGHLVNFAFFFCTTTTNRNAKRE